MSLKFKLVGYFLLLSLLPLAAATIGFRTVVTRSEERRVDVRLEASLRAALAAYDDELDRARRRVYRLSHSPQVQAALQKRDIQTLRAAIAASPNVRIVGRNFAVGAPHPNAARRTASLTGPDGRMLGTIIAAVPLDPALRTQLRTRAGIENGDRLVVVRRGVIPGRDGGPLTVRPGDPHTTRVGGGEYRALESRPLREPGGVAFAVLSPQGEIDRAIGSAERKLVLALLASLLLIGIVAWVIGRSIVRSLGQLARAANQIAEGRIGVRVPVRGSDEFGQLGRAFNTMAGQLEHRLQELTAERNRLRDVTSSFGEALAATHDVEQLRQAIVDAAVEATAAQGGVLTVPTGDPLEAGRTDRGTQRIDLPLRAGSASFGTLVLNGEAFTPEQRELAASLVAQAVIALENARLHGIVERQALIDELTGLANRRHADAHLHSEVSRAERFSGPLSIVLADLDDFKRINDRYGHLVGDLVLQEFAHSLRDCVRDIDMAGRWGGEEFILILPGTDAQGASHLAARVRAALVRKPILAPDGSRIEVTASFGVAAYPELGMDELVAAADAALYRAKREGKDRVVTAPAPTPRG